MILLSPVLIVMWPSPVVMTEVFPSVVLVTGVPFSRFVAVIPAAVT